MPARSQELKRMEKAFYSFCAVVAMATFVVLTVDAACTNKVVLTKFDIIDKDSNRVVTKLPIRREKNLKINVAVKVSETLNSPSYSSTLRLEAKIYHTFGSFTKKIDCPKQLPSCEFRKMSCNKMEQYLNMKVGCPVLSGLYGPHVIDIPHTIGDLSKEIPSFYLLFLNRADASGYLDIWDDQTGERIACIEKTISFYKDF